MSFLKILPLFLIFNFAFSNEQNIPQKKEISLSMVNNGSMEEEKLKNIDEQQIKEQKKANTELLSAYNSSARIDVKGSWDVYLSGSFIYWQAKEKGLEIAIAVPQSYATNKAHVKNMNFDYKPGFKAAICTNFDHDDWSLLAEYTRLHLSNTHTVYPKTDGYLQAVDTYYEDAETGTTNNNASYATKKWKLDYDMIDFEIGRPCYVGTKLTFKPHVGTRFGWIGQKIHSTYIFTTLVEPQEDIKASSHGRSTTWMVGPRGGVDTNWLFGKGFRFFANLSASLLYEQFKTSFKQENYQDLELLDKNVRRKIGFLVPNIDINTGLGWGSYFCKKNWHFDLAVGYDFIYYWNQNSMRSLEDLVLRNNLTKQADLMLHGLTVTLRFDF